MVERLKDKPFALLGINSDGDRDVSKKLDEKQTAAVRGLGPREGETLDKIRSGDAATITALGLAGPGIQGCIRDADRANLKQILETNRITWRQATEWTTSGPLARRWNVSGWPTIYVIDAQGVIRHRDLRDQELEDAVVKLLAETGADGKR